jgi:hypothetical protein
VFKNVISSFAQKKGVEEFSSERERERERLP